jgi:hypothetical protein
MSEVLGIRLTGKNAPEVVLFATMEDARGFGNSFMLYPSAESIASDIRRMSVEGMFEVYNSLVRSVYKWQSTEEISTRIEAAIAIWNAAIKRLPALQLKEPDMAKKVKEAEEVAEKPTKKGKSSEANGENGGGQRGRPSEHAGKRFVAKVGPAECGRREGSSRYNAFVIISNAGKTGIKYEDYIAKGGDGKLLSWFLSGDKVGVK